MVRAVPDLPIPGIGVGDTKMGNNMDAATSKKLEAEIAKLIAETNKINAEAKWYPFVVLAGVFGAALAVVKLLIQ